MPVMAIARTGRGQAHTGRDLLALMEDWPESWSVRPTDVPVGRAFVALMRNFLSQLLVQGLSRKTVRRHLHSLWAIGGEIIRDINDDDNLRRKPPRQLLLQAVEHSEAPLVHGATESDQQSFDATARKLRRFLTPGG